MKLNKKLKIVLAILIILTLAVVAFAGIYQKDLLAYKNVIKDYELMMSLQGKRIVNLGVNEATNEEIYDKDGKKVDSIPSGEDEANYTKKTVPVNPTEVLNQENFEKVKEIIEKRLNTLQVDEFEIRLNKENGAIELALPNNDNTDSIVGYLGYQGKFEILDSETKEVLLDNNQIKSAGVQYATTETGTTVFLSIQFNKESEKKLEEISQTYVKSTDNEGKEVTKNVKIQVDGSTLTETYFGYTIKDGRLQLSIGSATSSSESLQEYLTQASCMAAVIDNGKMPVQYKIQDNKLINSNFTKQQINTYTCAIITGIIILISIYFMIKYKKYGFFAMLSFLGCMALLLITIRYTNVPIGIESICAIALILILNTLLMNKILKNIKQKEVKPILHSYQELIDVFVILTGLSVVFSFISWAPITTIGMIGFWGIAITAIYHASISNLLLTSLEEKE